MKPIFLFLLLALIFNGCTKTSLIKKLHDGDGRWNAAISTIISKNGVVQSTTLHAGTFIFSANGLVAIAIIGDSLKNIQYFNTSESISLQDPNNFYKYIKYNIIASNNTSLTLQFLGNSFDSTAAIFDIEDNIILSK
jgi:hypothetical protein